MRVHRIMLTGKLHDIDFRIRQIRRVISVSSECQPFLLRCATRLRSDSRLMMQTMCFYARHLDICRPPTDSLGLGLLQGNIRTR